MIMVTIDKKSPFSPFFLALFFHDSQNWFFFAIQFFFIVIVVLFHHKYWMIIIISIPFSCFFLLCLYPMLSCIDKMIIWSWSKSMSLRVKVKCSVNYHRWASYLKNRWTIIIIKFQKFYLVSLPSLTGEFLDNLFILVIGPYNSNT